MLAASMLFCYVPYRRLAALKKNLEDISGIHVHYVDLFKHLLSMTNCKQLSWSYADQFNQTRQRELPFADCQAINEYVSCEYKPILNMDIQEIDKQSYIHYGCFPGANKQLIMLTINATLINVTIGSDKVLPGIILQPCPKQSSIQNITR
uniref:Uncharacterized protein n=1 Tax=Setaria digitata TaxID=48799 RepID=A0A915Q1E7_9BILA